MHDPRYDTESVVDAQTGEVLMSGLDLGRLWAETQEYEVAETAEEAA